MASKKFSLGYGGLAALGITFATLIPHTDELGNNTSAVGSFVGDLICIGQDLTGGMVQMPICTDTPAPTANDPALGQTD